MTSSPLSPDWVASLPAAKDADQLFVVAGMGENLTTATISLHQRDGDGRWQVLMTSPGFVGMHGLGKAREGDDRTPVGVFTFGLAFGLLPDPGCAVPYHQADGDDCWSGDPRPGMMYNRMVSLKDLPDLDLAASERIADFPVHYRYCLDLGYNPEGIPGLGSALFLHCLGPEKPYTGGCVALPEDKMRLVLRAVRPGCKVVIDTFERLGARWS